MRPAKVLLIGSIGVKNESFLKTLQKRYTVFIASSGKQGLVLAQEHQPQVVILDAISMRTPGERVCHMLRKNLTGVPIVHLHPGAAADTSSPADVLFVAPFTWRKVMNCLQRILETDTDEILTCGPFSMNVGRRLLIAHGQETQLTPKQAQLIEVFLRHPGEVLDRKLLMEKVWDTDYLGDTRTLDVHIRWLREALDDGADKPRYLKTVRGVGYRLEIPVDELEKV